MMNNQALQVWFYFFPSGEEVRGLDSFRPVSGWQNVYLSII